MASQTTPPEPRVNGSRARGLSHHTGVGSHVNLKDVVLKIRRTGSSNSGPRIVSPSGPRSEPGLDPRYVDLVEDSSEDLKSFDASGDEPQKKQDPTVRIVDYDREQISSTVKTPAEFSDWYENNARPAFSRVRWVHLNGLSWPVLKTLALCHKGIHSLALEDCFSGHTGRSKVDYYADALFLSVMFSTLHHNKKHKKSSKDTAQQETLMHRVLNLLRGGGKQKTKDLEGSDQTHKESHTESAEDKDPETPAFARGRTSEDPIFEGLSPSHQAQHALEALTAPFRLPLNRVHLSIFLMRDGTLISAINQTNSGFMEPIYERLAAEVLLLRESEDPSLLLQALLDLVVDNLLSITDAFRGHIALLEGRSLLRPQLETVRSLHTMQSQLFALRRRWGPLQVVLDHLMHNDRTRALAARNMLDKPEEPDESHKDVGFISAQCRVYLADVHDHLDEVLSGMEVFSSIAEGLTSYLFNYLSVETNDSMRALTVVSVVFIPFTAISSYFGMNFDEFAALKNQVSYYWAVTTPVVVVTILIFCSDYLVRFLKHVQRVAFHSDFRVRSAPLPSQP